MRMNRSQFTFYESFYTALNRIRNKEDRADAYDAICAYALYGTEPDLDSLPDTAAIAFDLIRPNLDSSRRKAKNGKSGGENKQTARKQEANDKQTASKQEANSADAGTKKEIEKEKEKEKEIENECYTPIVPYQQIVDMYNEICISFPRVTSLSDARKKAIKARMNSGYSLGDFKSLFTKAQASDFLKGKNDRNWTANFDWLVKDTNMAKVIDGNYDNKDGKNGKNSDSFSKYVIGTNL